LYINEFLATDPAFRPLLEALLELSLEIGVMDDGRLFLNFREILETTQL
jgi:hypothetical protein